MRTLRGAVVCAVIAAVIVVPASAHAAPPASPYDAMVLNPPVGGNWIISKDLSFDPGNAAFTMSGTTDGRNVTVAADGHTEEDTYALWFQPPIGQAFTAGTTYQARRFPDLTYAQLEFTATGRGCNQQFGWFTVKEVERDTDGKVSVFAATFAVGCETAARMTTGEVRWKSTVPYSGKVADIRAIDFGTQDVGFPGTARTVTVTSTGAVPTVFGAAAVQGDAPGAFLIAADGCAGRTLEYGQTCTVSVKARPSAAGEQRAQLVIPDNTFNSGAVVGLTVNGMVGATGMYYPLWPQRLLDTRNGTGAPRGAVGPGGTVELQINGRGGVPSTGVGAVVLNVTVTGPTTSGHVTVYPSGTIRPTASSLNFVPGWTGANSVTVQVGANGRVVLYNSSGQTHLIADVVGFYAANNDPWWSHGPGGQLFTHSPSRVLDTRRDFNEKLPAGYYVTVPIDYGDEVNPHVRAVVVNITAVDPSGAGYLTGWHGKLPMPETSTLNYGRATTVPNLAIVSTLPCGSDCGPGGEAVPMIGVYTSQDTHVIVDVVGFLDNAQLGGGLRFKPNSPTRIADSRIGQGIAGPIAGGATADVTTPDSLAGPETYVLALNVTAVAPTANTFMTVWQTGTARPDASNLNPRQGQIIPNAVVTDLDAAKRFSVYNNAGSVNVVVDVVGTFFSWHGAAAFSAGLRGGAPVFTVPADLTPRPLTPALRQG